MFLNKGMKTCVITLLQTYLSRANLQKISVSVFMIMYVVFIMIFIMIFIPISLYVYHLLKYESVYAELPKTSEYPYEGEKSLNFQNPKSK